ncbi:hypothetical protein BY996DRAFT_6602981 [Phakopsora pachyrhizi]|nr:hypothetical protein BY996DRAFT_6602981 [Phakopsora pachyrhizi]
MSGPGRRTGAYSSTPAAGADFQKTRNRSKIRMRKKDKSRNDKVIPLATDKRCWFRCRQKNVGRSELNSKEQSFWTIFEFDYFVRGKSAIIRHFESMKRLRSMEEDWELEQKTLNEDEDEVMEDIRGAAKPTDLRRGSNSHGNQEDRGDWPMASDEDLRQEKQELVKDLRILEIRECYPVLGVINGSTERCCALQARFGTRNPNLSLGGSRIWLMVC